ncbi:MAG: peptidoglycan bridge formation glycyltransferase FemA/FemB family protein, partial [Enterococcus sp.]|nr:peptidoglycan bridge formation glycyltransferase FemA/FemB family protein [Enterococcus sp.]
MYTFKIGIPAEVHDTFVKNHPLCNLLQSSSWSKVKDNWGSEIVGVYEKDTLVASSLVLIKPLPAGFTMLYTPRGPVMDYTNERLVSYFMAELKKFGKKKRALFIKM